MKLAKFEDQPYNPQTAMSWLIGGGEMGDHIRNFDWSSTPLGAPEFWPQSLKTSLNICLNSKFPMFVWWGEKLLVFYNDAFIPLAGEHKHPMYLGHPAKEQWPEIWNQLAPFTEHVLK